MQTNGTNATLKRMEPDVSVLLNPDNGAVDMRQHVASIAISLKRIADSLKNIDSALEIMVKHQ